MFISKRIFKAAVMRSSHKGSQTLKLKMLTNNQSHSRNRHEQNLGFALLWRFGSLKQSGTTLRVSLLLGLTA